MVTRITRIPLVSTNLQCHYSISSLLRMPSLLPHSLCNLLDYFTHFSSCIYIIIYLCVYVWHIKRVCLLIVNRNGCVYGLLIIISYSARALQMYIAAIQSLDAPKQCSVPLFKPCCLSLRSHTDTIYRVYQNLYNKIQNFVFH